MTPYSHSESGRPPRGSGGRRPHVEETTLRTEKIQVERKLFIFTLKENARGRFLRVTEDVNGRRDHIIVPTTGLDEFARVARELADAEAEHAANEPDEAPVGDAEPADDSEAPEA